MSTYLSCIDEKSLSVGSLAAYINWANRIPLLSRTEEHELTQRLKYQGDLAAARKLILSHLRFVIKIARGYSGYGLQQADLIQEGNIGLMKAVKRFDPNVGVRLVSFAVHWIRAEIHEFVLRNWRIVKIATTKAQRKLFFNLRKHAKKRGWFSNAEVNAIAEQLNVSHKDVRQMEARLNNYDEPFDIDYDNDSSQALGWNAPAHYLQDKSHGDPATQLENCEWCNNQENHLQRALKLLDERSRDILQQRWLSEQKATLHQLAEKYNVSAERIRQLEKQAIEKIRELFTD